jgi:hypothetical protein
MAMGDNISPEKGALTSGDAGAKAGDAGAKASAILCNEAHEACKVGAKGATKSGATSADGSIDFAAAHDPYAASTRGLAQDGQHSDKNSAPSPQTRPRNDNHQVLDQTHIQPKKS